MSLYSERIVPDETEPGVVALHLKRYDFARAHCVDRLVLDAACGVGYGTAYLADVAARVVGVDRSEEALAYARRCYARENAEFVAADITALPFADASFDVVCSFETIEHVDEPERALAELARIVQPKGTLVLSTPHVRATTRESPNPHHRVELGRADLERLLRGRFEDVEIYGQRRVETARHRLARRLDVFGLRRRVRVGAGGARLTGSRSTAELTLDDIVIARDAVAQATELIAVCRRPRIQRTDRPELPLHSNL
jgi:SAM-dependent methyltransferase